ncbi:MAG: acetylornithine deacetylase [Burkholderiales bacterium]|nr:acetylornithine deacetylase [Burkholderiales bacterium]
MDDKRRHTPSFTSFTSGSTTLEWAQRLVRLDTVSARSNLALIETIADELRTLGVPLRLTYDDERQKANLFATLGEGKPAGLVLSGHTDTVPWDGQAWSREPLAAAVEDSRLYGRGSADMKSYIGAVVAQTKHWLDADLPFALHYAFSYDEEVGAFGVRRLLADLADLREAGRAPRLCIIGEPTEMVPAVAHKGVYRWRCSVKGHAAHSSLTPHAVNAVEAAARVIAHIAGIGDELRETGLRQAGFDVPYTTAAVCVVQGGIADNVVPEDCRFHYEFRNLPDVDAEALHARVVEGARALEPAMQAVDPATGIRFESITEMPSFKARPDEPAVALALRLAGATRTTHVAFGTEAGLFQRAGISTVVCGPGSINQAHQADEYVSLDQLARCEAFLRGITHEGAGFLAR